MMKSPHKKTEVDVPAQGADAASASLGRGDYGAIDCLSLSVPGDCGGLRLDQVLARLRPQHSRNRLQGWIREGRVSINGAVVSEAKTKLWGGEQLRVTEAADERSESAQPGNIPAEHRP